MIKLSFCKTTLPYSTFNTCVFECVDLLTTKCAGHLFMKNAWSLALAEPSASYPWQYQLPLSVYNV